MHSFPKAGGEMPKKYDVMDQSTEEKVQCPEDQQAPGYDNNHPTTGCAARTRTLAPCRTSITHAQAAKCGDRPWQALIFTFTPPSKEWPK